MRLLMLGPPGSGKGTHGTRLSEEHGVVHVSSGDVLRAELANGTPLGRKLAGYLAKGDLVPDDVLFELLVPIAVSAAQDTGGFIADGFPRTPAQARRAYQEIGIDRDLPLQAVVSLVVPEPVLMQRLLDRARVQGRADDTPEIIQHRLDMFREQTEPLVDYYRGRRILLPIDGDQSTDEVYVEIKTGLAERGIIP